MPPAAIAATQAVEPACQLSSVRPGPGNAAVDQTREGDVTLVRYSATPRDAPCATLDILFRVRGGNGEIYS